MCLCFLSVGSTLPVASCTRKPQRPPGQISRRLRYCFLPDLDPPQMAGLLCVVGAEAQDLPRKLCSLRYICIARECGLPQKRTSSITSKTCLRERLAAYPPSPPSGGGAGSRNAASLVATAVVRDRARTATAGFEVSSSVCYTPQVVDKGFRRGRKVPLQAVFRPGQRRARIEANMSVVVSMTVTAC